MPTVLTVVYHAFSVFTETFHNVDNFIWYTESCDDLP